MRRSGVFLPTSCSSHLLSALQQKRAQSNLLYLFNYIESVNSPRIAFNFQNKLFFQSEQQCRQHAPHFQKARYKNPIRILVRLF